jgi:hypothetical protein
MPLLAWRTGRAVLLRGVLLGLLGASLGLASPAGADDVLLVNGNRLVGQLQLSQLPVMTAEGMRQVAPGDVRELSLGTVGGDLLVLRSGGVLAGWVTLAAYPVRLTTGQTIVVERARLDLIRFTRR